jgi:DNA-binding FadR family transcriptional regulator
LALLAQSAGSPSEFLAYVLGRGARPGDRLPALPDLARELGISTPKLREQVEVAQALGLIEIKPKTGIRLLAFDFTSTLRLAVDFALAQEAGNFQHISDLRNHVEAAFWHAAVRRLTADDRQRLVALVRSAWEKLQGDPIQIPHAEHRALHMTIFSRCENPFVRGILEVYWEAYEAVGLSLYADYAYLKEVWEYHQAMVDAISKDDLEGGYRALVAHTGLLQARPDAPRGGAAPATARRVTA